MEPSSRSVARPEAPPWWGDLIHHYPVLEALPPSLLSELYLQASLVRLPAGAVAFDEDSPCAGLVLIMQGSVRVVRSSLQGREIMLYRVLPGESCILSVGCLLGRTPIAARGIVEGDLVGVNVPERLFETLVSKCPAFRVFIFELFGSRVGALLQLVEEVAFHRLDHRLAAHLLRLFADGGAAELELTHQDLADQVGTVREIVSRLLESFEQQSCIALSRGKVRLLRPELLRELAGPVGDAL